MIDSELTFAFILALLAVGLMIGAAVFRPWPSRLHPAAPFAAQPLAPGGYAPQGWQQAQPAVGPPGYGQQAGVQAPPGGPNM